MVSYCITDHLGSTRAVVDNSGEVLESFDYYPFGLLMPKRNTTGAGTMEKFTGKERDEAIGLDYFGARYYDAALGRWHGVDPLAGEYLSWSSYNYTLNNPVNLIDPDGMAVEETALGTRYTGENAQDFFKTLVDQYGTGGNSSDGDSEDERRSACVGLTCDVQTTLTAASYGSSGLGATQIGMIEYRKLLPISNKIGTFPRFSAIYSNVGLVSKGLGAAAGVGSVVSIGIDGFDVYSGNLSMERAVFRTAGRATALIGGMKIGVAFGGPYGAVGGALIGGAFVGGEYLYDTVLVPTGNRMYDQLRRIQLQIQKYENSLKRGHYPRIRR